MKKINKVTLFEVSGKDGLKENPILLRVILTNEYTKVEFGYSARSLYIKGGWIRISPYSFIEVVETGKTYKLTNAIGIPIAPEQHHFESKKDWQFFSLIFEPIPLVDCTINVIEEVNPDVDDFNYYGINLDMNKGTRIREAITF